MEKEKFEKARILDDNIRNLKSILTHFKNIIATIKVEQRTTFEIEIGGKNLFINNKLVVEMFIESMDKAINNELERLQQEFKNL